MSRVQETAPSNQMVYPWGLSITQENKEALSNVYKSLGNNIVLNGLNDSVTFTATTVTLHLEPGTAIQDLSLLELVNADSVSLDISGFDPSGMLVNYLFFSSPASQFKLGLCYIDNTASDLWDVSNNKVVLNTYKFIKDTSNNITSINPTEDNFTTVTGTTYYKKGLHHDNIFMSNMLSIVNFTSNYVKSDYHASINETILADTTTGTFDLFLPQNPPMGSKVVLIDCAGNFWNNAVRVNPNGSKLNGELMNIFFRFRHSITDFYYSGQTYGWIYNVTRMWNVNGGTF